MAEPEIQYARTSDGVSIAFYTIGEGPPLIHLPPPYPHLQLERGIEGSRRWAEELARTHQVVRYDPRGWGMSDREVANISPESQLLDLEAVAERVGITSYALVGASFYGPIAIMWAARRPEAVTHLILFCSTIRGSDALSPSQLSSARALVDVDWDLYTETVSQAVYGWEGGPDARAFAALMRESATPAMVGRFFDDLSSLDVSDQLGSVRAPTLVVHRGDAPYPNVDVQRQLAAGIPNARLAVLEGQSLAPFVGDMAGVLRAIRDFLGVENTVSDYAIARGDVQTILFTDIVRHTEMMSRLGDAKGRDVLREHERITRAVLKAHGGTEVKTIGDGFMASFGSVTKAVECAVAMQKAFAEHEGEELSVRVGLNAGEPIEEDGDLFGATVILASRIAAKAEGGEILVADTVRGLCSGKGFLFSDRGEFVAKGFDEPVRVYEVRWRDG